MNINSFYCIFYHTLVSLKTTTFEFCLFSCFQLWWAALGETPIRLSKLKLSNWKVYFSKKPVFTDNLGYCHSMISQHKDPISFNFYRFSLNRICCVNVFHSFKHISFRVYIIFVNYDSGCMKLYSVLKSSRGQTFVYCISSCAVFSSLCRFLKSQCETHLMDMNLKNLGWPVAEAGRPVSPLDSSPSPVCRCRSAESCK